MNYCLPLKDARLQAVIDFIDNGVGAGRLRIGTTAMATLLVSIPLAQPCGTAANGVLTFGDMPRQAASVAVGQAASAQLIDATGAVVVDELIVTVTGGGGHIELDTVNVSAVGQIINLTSAEIHHA